MKQHTILKQGARQHADRELHVILDDSSTHSTPDVGQLLWQWRSNGGS